MPVVSTAPRLGLLLTHLVARQVPRIRTGRQHQVLAAAVSQPLNLVCLLDGTGPGGMCTFYPCWPVQRCCSVCQCSVRNQPVGV
jgi:hypothetical protein